MIAKEDFSKLAEEQYKQLETREEELKKELRETKERKIPLRAYLVKSGVFGKRTRNKKELAQKKKEPQRIAEAPRELG